MDISLSSFVIHLGVVIDCVIVMASLGQHKGARGHVMASFDKHSRCARCRDKNLGENPCIKKLPCEYCELLTPEQVIQLATPTHKLRKEKQKERDFLVDPASVTVLSPVGHDKPILGPSSHNTSEELSVPCGTLVCVWETFRLRRLRRLRILFSL